MATLTTGSVATPEQTEKGTGGTEAPVLCYLCKVELCDYCGMCEQDSCMFYGKAVTTKAQMIELKHLVARTQKAKGYVAIAEALNVPKPFSVIDDVEEISATIKRLGKVKIFARPCPVRPRHGFVESRVVAEPIDQNLRQILQEAKDADPEAELLVVPAINAEYNLILTPSRMAVGKGNDGATAGKGSKSFPLAGVPFKEIPQELAKRAGVNIETDDPYIEVVLQGKGNSTAVYYTQLRAGVRIPPAVGADFIPDRMQVLKVVQASGDLLEWERQVQKEIGPGTAVYHTGGTLISHYGVHCMYNNIPILTSRIPEVGEVLEPIAKAELPSPDAVIRGLAMGASEKVIELERKSGTKGVGQTKVTCPNAVSLLLVAAHNAAAMSGDDGVWIGIAASLMIRLGMAASHGEARHKAQNFKGSREMVYNLALNDFFGARKTLGHAQWRFKNLSWGGSYGGPKWAACTESVLRLEKDCRKLLQDPSNQAVADLVSSLHNAINQAHNGGWWLNKFISASEFDNAAAQSVQPICNAAPAIFNILSLEDVQGLDEFLTTWREAKDIDVSKGYTVGDTNGSDDSPAEDNDGDEKCGDSSCTTCYPSDSEPSGDDDDDDDDDGGSESSYDPTTATGNVNGHPAPSGSVITEAQAKMKLIGTTKIGIHVQYKLDKINPKAYYSVDGAVAASSPVSSGWLKLDSLETGKSYAGSGNTYIPMAFEPVKDKPGYWRIFHDDLKVSFEVHVGGV